MNYTEFLEASKSNNVIPVFETYMADLLTPVSAFLRLQALSDKVFLLESVAGGEKTARFSFLGYKPNSIIYFKGGNLEIHSDGKVTYQKGTIFHYLHERFKSYKAKRIDILPRFTGGAVGYFGYETIKYIESIPLTKESPAGFPEAMVMLFDTVLAFDHVRHQIFIIKNIFLAENPADPQVQFEHAKAQIRELRQALTNDLSSKNCSTAVSEPVLSNVEKAEFIRTVKRAKEYIKAGDIFQVVLSQKFKKRINVDAFDIYRALRVVNPSPYLYFLRNGDTAIIGSSPELLVRVENRDVEVRPIAGTRRRGVNSQEDQALSIELCRDKKEIAEHVMLVDLGRNDLGKVSEPGSVEVDEFMAVEKYSHVMHLVSNVKGKLCTGLTALDALKACFPAGTVSGAPKIRAMEIINELEAEARGVYAGALGYLDFSGNLDTCIAIRTIVTKGQIAYFQAGAGIVADSDPEREYQETVDKSAALRAAIDFAERGLHDYSYR